MNAKCQTALACLIAGLVTLTRVTSQTGCASFAPKKPSSPVQPPEWGRVGLASVAVEPQLEAFDMPRTHGLLEDKAVQGSAAGAVYHCLYLLAVPPAYGICVASFAAVGVAGGAASGDAASRFESALQGVPTSMELQYRLRSRVLAQARTLTDHEIVDLGPDGIEYRPPPDPGQPAPEETQEPEDDSTAVNDYRRFSLDNADTVLETAVVRYATWASGNERYGLRLEARSRLVRTRDGVVIALARHDFASPSYTFERWTENEAERLHSEIQKGIDSLAKDIARYFL